MLKLKVIFSIKVTHFQVLDNNDIVDSIVQHLYCNNSSCNNVAKAMAAQIYNDITF